MSTDPTKLAAEYVNYYVNDELSNASSVLKEFYSGDDSEPIPTDFDSDTFIKEAVELFRLSLIEDVKSAMDL